MQDAWRAYLDLALGLTETSRKKATKVARKLVGRGNATAEQLQSMAEDLVSTSLANREALVRLVRFELERGLNKVGLATAEEVNALTARVRELEQHLEAARDGRDAAAEPVPLAEPVPATPVKKTVAKKTAAKKVVAKKTAAPAAPTAAPAAPTAAPVEVPEEAAPVEVPEEAAPAVTAVADNSAPAPAPARKTAAKQAPAKQTPVKKAVQAPVKKAAAKQTPVKRTTARKAPAQAGEAQ